MKFEVYSVYSGYDPDGNDSSDREHCSFVSESVESSKIEAVAVARFVLRVRNVSYDFVGVEVRESSQVVFEAAA